MQNNLIKVLFIGDVVGKPGRTILKKNLKKLKEALEPDFIIVNIENLANQPFVETIDSNCHLKGINTIEGSFNNINFACVAKKIFTPLANDLSNLLTLSSY